MQTPFTILFDGYTVRRPINGPSDEWVAAAINLHHDGEMAFRFGEMARAVLTGRKVVILSGTYEA